MRHTVLHNACYISCIQLLCLTFPMPQIHLPLMHALAVLLNRGAMETDGLRQVITELEAQFGKERESAVTTL